MYNLYIIMYSNPSTHLTELCQDGVDQRDHYYFLGVGYYKLEVSM